jgi:hypothetical protein
MTTTWTNDEKLAGQIAIAYNAAVQYNDPLYQYNGKAATVWTLDTKH